MPSEEVSRLLAGTRSSLVAPAGCGKTHLIAVAVGHLGAGARALVLTHTHAGVDALRRRMRLLGTAGSAHVETIAGWALRYATAFPSLSGVADLMPDNSEAWIGVYKGACRVLANPHVARTVQLSYTDVFIDEYQDCTVQQHALACSLSRLLPCRVLGDPLQAIFRFGTNEVVPWDEVERAFPPLAEMVTPWRWVSTNRNLGVWLLGLRELLRTGGAIDLRTAPDGVRWVEQSDQQTQTRLCHRIRGLGGTAVAISRWPSQCNALASRLRRAFLVIDPIDCGDLYEAADRIGESEGADRADALVGFAGKCMTKAVPEMRSILRGIRSGRARTTQYRHPDQQRALLLAVDEPSAENTVAALYSLARLQGAVVYRKEPLQAMKRALHEYESGDYESLREAAWHCQERARRTGRRPEQRIVGRTVLVKGLEFDHSILFEAHEMDAENLYVALTRASRTITVVAPEQVLQPQPSVWQE